MMDDWREKFIKTALNQRIAMYQELMESDEKDIQWAKDNEFEALENWFVGRVKGYASAQNTLRDILNMFPGEGDA